MTFHLRPLGALVLSGVVGVLAGDGACAPATYSGLGVDGDDASAYEAPYIETGDLRQLRERGQLRALVHSSEAPSGADTLSPMQRAVERMARDLGLKVRWIPVASWDGLIPALQEGRGDLIASPMTLTPETREEAAFSLPLDASRLQLLVPVDGPPVERPQDLAGLRIAAWPGSTAWASMAWLAEQYPGLELVSAPQSVGAAELMSMTAAGAWDGVVLPSHLSEAALAARPDLKVGFNLTPEQTLAFAMRRESLLLAAVDRHLAASLGPSARGEKGDLDAISERGVLRVLTRADPTTAYLRRGRIVGFEYELIQAFADERGLEVELVVPPARAELMDWLVAGRGDVIAAGIAAPDEPTDGAVAFTRPYNFVSEVVISRADEGPVEAPEDLDGRAIALHEGTPLWASLVDLRDELSLDLELVPVPADMPRDEIMARVADGTWDLTVVASHLADAVVAWRDDLAVGVALRESAHSWVTRGEDTELLAALDDHLDRAYRGVRYNMTWSRYFKGRRYAPAWLTGDGGASTPLSPWDDAVRAQADAYGFDWRLIVAQMFQESRFRPEVRSHRGAEGLMQVLPSTREALGLPAGDDPDASIRAGVMYLARMRSWLPPELTGPERIWFALAAYNVGIGHLEDARALAAELGLNPNRWFGHTEVAMLKLSEASYARAARYGYCRGEQPVAYVRAVQRRYLTYLRLARADEPGAEWLSQDDLLSPTPLPGALALLN